MTSNTSSLNAGVHANVGMDFQKNCAVYLFLEKYSQIRLNNYYILIEHLDDIVFAYVNANGELDRIETFQAKKASSPWSLSKIVEVIHKISKVNQEIDSDSHPKSNVFAQENNFATNNSIELNVDEIIVINGVKQKIPHAVKINESAENVAYGTLVQQIRTKIEKGNKAKSIVFTKTDIDALSNCNLKFIDLGRTSGMQINALSGKFEEVFGATIRDCRAALIALLVRLHEVETTFNQNQVASISDNKKRITSSELEAIIGDLVRSNFAFEEWKEHGKNISKALSITIAEKKQFQTEIFNSIDSFKSPAMTEYQSIKKFVEQNADVLSMMSDDCDAVLELHTRFLKTKSSTLTDVQLKATIVAAYIVLKSTI